jgi:hypothetical protein
LDGRVEAWSFARLGVGRRQQQFERIDELAAALKSSS